MRYNKQELMALAHQTSPNFDREGVLLLKEKQDGFFRRSEGCSIRWFRLRGNLLFYLKGAEPWYEPIGVIVLGHHQIKVQNQDENGHWPFQIVWENGVSYRMATFHESERTLWLKDIQMAPYEAIRSQLTALKERLNRIQPVLDVATYRLQKGIVSDMNEVPLCELALSCDNLLCDTHGRPPSPLVVVYVKFHKGLCVRYGATEIVDTCSNPCFCKTILFRASDGLTGDAVVRLVVYDVRERVSETEVPMGFTAMPLSTIQEAQRLRVALQTNENKTVGFVTINGWSLEPSYIGTSPSHTNDKNSIDIPQKVLCHRRSQSLPPRLGVKLKFPSYGTLLKQNFVNSHQVTYRFHSGLGGDITVHEIMAEPKICYQIPIQLLDIYIQREKELLEELLSVGEMCSQWQSRYLDLVSIHVASLKQYCHAKRCMQHADPPYFKASSRKDEVGLEFAPVNLHLQRMWVHNDTLNKTGSHDIITVGAFTAHNNKAERNGGLIKQVQQSKEINNPKAALHAAAANKIQADSDNVMAARKLREQIVHDLEQIVVLLQAKQGVEASRLIDGIKSKTKSLLSIFDATAIEETLSYIGWPKTDDIEESDSQTMSTIMRLTEQLSVYDNTTTITDCENYDLSTSSSSKDTSPTADHPGLSASVPNLIPNNKKIVENTDDELQFHNDYFNDRQDKLNHSFRSVKSAKFGQDSQSFSFDSHKQRASSLRHDFKSSASLEQVSYRCLMDNVNGDRRKNCDVRRDSIPPCNAPQLDAETRRNNLAFLQNVATGVDYAVDAVIEDVLRTVHCQDISDEQLDATRSLVERVGRETAGAARWLRVAHAALRLRTETPRAARERAALRAARDQCAAAALTTVTAGLLCWLSSTPADIVVKILTSGLGPLCTFEGLLSLYSNEKAMWGDMVVAVEDLHTVVFELVKVGHSNSALPQVTGTRGALTVHIPVSDSLYTRFTNKEHLKFTITAVFFNIGINEKATLAEARGETAPQTHSNSDNLGRIFTYCHKHTRLFTAPRGSSRTKPLEEVMENLRTAVNKRVPKNTEVLHMAALATRLMYGLRFTSCKSAKDRTGMSVTIEQCSILAQEYHLDEMEAKKALSVMRSEGCRRENTLKNIGVKKYAFTKKQVMDLPEDYRPPPGTYGSSQT